MVKCRFTRDRIIITTLGVLAFGLGLGLMIPGIIMSLASPPDMDYLYSLNLCPRNESSSHHWVVRPANESCSTQYPLESLPQRIPIDLNVLGDGYPYTTSLVLTDKAEATVQYSLHMMTSADDDEGEEVERTKLMSTSKLSSLDHAELEKPFDFCGGEQIRIWRDPPYASSASGYFPDGLERCTEQPSGCEYEPLRSLDVYSVDHFEFESDSWTRAPVIQVNVADVFDPSGADIAPDLLISINAGSSSANNTGNVLFVIGLIIADISPGIAYYLMTRLKPPRRKRR
jgi:hypothetical protein